MTEVLVTGGGGYLGGHVVDLLAERGHRVLVLDPLLYGNRALRGLRAHPNVTWMQQSADNPISLSRALRSVRAVVHLAALVGDPLCSARPVRTFVTNYLSIFPLSWLARLTHVRRVVFTSSCSVYEGTRAEPPYAETAPVAPRSLYARTRLAAEGVLLRQDAVPITVLRLSTLCGWAWRMRFDLVANRMTLDACRHGLIRVVDGHRHRPLLHVRDAARAIVSVLEAPGSSVDHQVFNVGAATHNGTLDDLASAVALAVPGARIERAVSNLDQTGYAVDFAKIATRLAFRPTRSLGEAVAEVRDRIMERTDHDWDHRDYYNTSLTAAMR
jgi:nucleoside-diphosphate-sugar epimerase